MILAFFDLQVTLIFPTKSTGLLVQEKFKIDFQDGHHGGHLGFPIRMILAIFDLQVTLILPIKFRVNWPSVQEKKFKIELPLLPSLISYWNNFSCFLCASHPDTSYQVSS